MAITIKQESELLRRSLSDIDNYRLRYFSKEESEDDILKINFVSPSLIVWEENKFYLLKYSDYQNISPSKFYRPDYVSYDFYGTTNLWSMLLYLNDIYTIEEFTKDRILVPTKSSILALAKLASTRKAPQEIIRDITIPTTEKSTLYYPKRKVRLENQPLKTIKSSNVNERYQRQQFIINHKIITDQYIDLETEPIENSIIVRMQDSGPFLMNLDYKLLKSVCDQSLTKKRLSWNNSRYTELSFKLNSEIQIGKLLEITYASVIRNSL